MNNTPENKNFTNFSEKEWVDFLSHRLSPEKEAEFLKISNSQEFSQEAIEGMELVPNRAHVLSSINNVNSKVRERAGNSSESSFSKFKLNYYRIGAIAAIFVVIIGLGSLIFFITNQSHEEPIAKVNAETMDKSSEVITPIINSDANVSSTPISDSVSKLDTTSNTASTVSSIPPQSVVAVNSNTASKSIVLASKKTLEKKQQTIATATPSKSEIKELSEVSATYLSAADLAPASGKTSMTTTATPAAAPVPPPPTSIESKSVVSKEEINSNITQYQSGIDEMNKGNTDEAIKNFDKVISQNSGYKVDAKWNKAQLLIKKGEQKKAKKLLQELSENENPYKNRAKDLLKSLP